MTNKAEELLNSINKYLAHCNSGLNSADNNQGTILLRQAAELIREMQPNKAKLQELLDGITPENRHPELIRSYHIGDSNDKIPSEEKLVEEIARLLSKIVLDVTRGDTFIPYDELNLQAWEILEHLSPYLQTKVTCDTNPTGQDNGWMPIETIPRDGTKCLVASVDNNEISRVSTVYYGKGVDGNYRWYGDSDSICYAKYWRPITDLPIPPTSKGE